MTARDFAYWLQGLFELGNPTALDAAQTDLVKRHLALVFVHDIDPRVGGPDVQKVLQEIHDAAAHQAPPSTLRPPKIGGEGPGGIKYRC
jgi:hypothetical protein